MLLDQYGLTWSATELGPVDLQVAADRVGRPGKSFALFDRVDRRQPIDDRHALDEGNGAGPQPDHAVREICRNVLRKPPANRRRADWHRAQPLTSSSSFSWPARCCWPRRGFSACLSSP